MLLLYLKFKLPKNNWIFGNLLYRMVYLNFFSIFAPFFTVYLPPPPSPPTLW